MTNNLNNKRVINNLTLIHDDCLNVLKLLPDNCIDLILTDPPYFRVKKDKWDNQWQNVEDYLSWLDDIFAEFWRILKPSGSLYCFCSSKLSAKTECLISERFNVLNHIVWAKPNGSWLRQNKESLRSYFSSSERVIFAEHYKTIGKYKGDTGYTIKCRELKESVFEPLINYFKNARALVNASATDINNVTNTQMCSHWFSSSQWQLPNEQQYKALQTLFNRLAKDKNIFPSVLSDNFKVLSTNYQILLRQYYV